MAKLSEIHKSIRTFICCLIVTLICLAIAFTVIFVPMLKCKIRHSHYTDNNLDENTTDRKITINECIKDENKSNILSERNINGTLKIQETEIVHYSLCYKHKSICVPMCILMVFAFICICVSGLCKAFEVCCMTLFGGRQELLHTLGLKYNIVKKLESNKMAIKIEQDDIETWRFVNQLIRKTWIYTEQAGRDAKNLNHNGIEIKHIYAVQNDGLLLDYSVSLKKQNQHKEISKNYSHTNKLLTRRLSQTNGKYEENNPTLNLISNQLNRAGSGESKKWYSFGQTDQRDGYDIRQPKKPSTFNLGDDEMYLFHGTKVENVKRIIEHGFCLDKAKPGALYGQGIYLTDSCQKADQYSDFSKARREYDLALIIVRTILGNVGLYEDCDQADLNKAFDTVIAGKGKRFCEVIKYNSLQCYPAFVVIYDRSFDKQSCDSV